MKKVLFITTRPIYPITGGREVVLYNYCKGLNEIFNCEIDLISFIDDKEYNLTPKFINKQYIVNQPSKLEKIYNAFTKSIILKKWPLQVSVYYSKKTKQYISKLIKDVKPDILICDMARTAEYIRDIKGFNGKKVLDMDDLLSKRYYRQSKNLKSSNNIFGQYQKKLPKSLQKIFSGKKLSEKILTSEARLLEKYEVEVSNDFDNIIFVSPIEAEELNKKMRFNKAFDVTIGVDYDYYSKIISKNKCKNLIGFLGNMYIPHNRDAVDHFLNNIFPLVKNKISDSKFRIIGKCSNEYKDKFRFRDDVEVTGEVDDIRKYVQECSTIVAPLLYGSGIKTKILESMAMGVPVVTNDIGVEGINAKNGMEIFVENNIEDFSNSIIHLLGNYKLTSNISVNSQKFILNNHTWYNTLKNFNKIIKIGV